MVKKVKTGGVDKWDAGVKYATNIMLVVCVYAVLFGMRRLDAEYNTRYFGWEQAGDIKQLLCMISGIPIGGVITDIQIYQWLCALSTVFILVGREVYGRQEHLRYIAMIRYGSYRKFYYHLMNRTGFQALIYGGTGTLAAYALYVCQVNGEVSGRVFLEMCGMYLPHLVLLCLIQTVCMIWTEGYAASVVLLISWFVMVVLGDWLFRERWVWLPCNWGMYIRSARMVDGGVPVSMYYIQAGICVLLWAVVPLVLHPARNSISNWME